MVEPSASEWYMQTKHLRCWFKPNLCRTSGHSSEEERLIWDQEAEISKFSARTSRYGLLYVV